MRLLSEKKTSAATIPSITATATDKAGMRLTDVIPDKWTAVGGVAEVGAGTGVPMLYVGADGLGTEGVTFE